MDRNSIIGLLLIGLILIGFSVWNQPTAEEIAASKQTQDSIEAATRKSEEKQIPVAATPIAVIDSLPADSLVSGDSLKAALLINKYGVFAASAEGTEQFYYLENKLIKVAFTNKGGRVYSVELKNYKTYNQKPLELFESDTTSFGLNFFAQNRDVSTNGLYFEPIQDKKGKISFRLKSSGAGYVEYQYTLPEDGYLLDFSINLSGMENVIDPISTTSSSTGNRIFTRRKRVLKWSGLTQPFISNTWRMKLNIFLKQIVTVII